MSKLRMTSFNYTNTQYFAGFITYWKLFFQLISQISNSPIYLKKEKVLLLFNLIIVKSIWYLIIKPFGFVFSYKKNYIGEMKEYIYENSNFKELGSVNATKTTIFYLFRVIPFFFYRTKKLSQSDIKYLRKG